MGDTMAHPAWTREDASAASHAKGRACHADDVFIWFQGRVALLRSRQVDVLDLDDVAEALREVGLEQSDKLESAIEVSLAHVPKWGHGPEKRSLSWSRTIAEQRMRINTQLHRNSGLESRIVEAVADRYRLGQLRAARTMKRSLETLPAECPYNGDAIVNRPFEFEADR
ncbi:DUF29 domain-containing protein [Methylobacterium sp. CM6246]